MKTTLLRIGAIAFSLQMLSVFAETQILYVDLSGTNPTSPYGSWDTAANSIAEALAAVNAEAEAAVINVAPGVYETDAQITVDKANVTIQSCDKTTGALALENTILDGGYPARYPKATTNRLFQIQRENVKLRGLTLQNAYVAGQGGGVLVDGSYGNNLLVTSFIIDSCVISNCHAIAGNNSCGGGVNYSMSVNRNHIITNSVIRNCAAVKLGGGISGESKTDLRATRDNCILITDSEFIDNELKNKNVGGATGGIHFGYGSAYVEKCLVKGGSDDKTSSLMNGWGWSVFTNCVFESFSPVRDMSHTGKTAFYNSLFHSTVLSMPAATVEIAQNCVFSNITAMSQKTTVFGCHIRNCLWTRNNHPLTSNGTVENCTIVSNNTTAVLMQGKGVKPSFINCIIYGNKYDANYNGASVGKRSGTQDWTQDPSGSLTFKNCYIEDGDTAEIPNPQAGKVSTKLQDFDSTGATAAIIAKAKAKGPGFVDEANGDWRLTRKSPLRDAGLNADWMVGATDLEGKPRLLQLNGKYSATAIVDLGCYECDLPISEGLRLFLR